MENYAYTSYAESGESSPRSRDVDYENPPPWEEQSAVNGNGSNYKVKFMCSYGGKILPRPHDNQLSYVGGETKILAVDRFVKFAVVISKLTTLCDGDVCFKYQLPGEDLDALISVTNDDDLEHMMHEYDRLNRASPIPARLRLFLFPVSGQSPALTPVQSFGSTEGRSERERFMDALNNGHVQSTAPPSAVPLRARDHHIADPQIHTPEQEVPVVDDRAIEADRLQKHIQDLHRLRIAEEQQPPPQPTLYRKPSDDNLAGGYTGDYYVSKMTENVAPATGYQISGGFTGTTISPDQQAVYMIQTPASMYHAPMARPGGNTGYYVQRMPPPTDVYRDQQQVYNVMQPQQPPPPQAVATQQTTVSSQQQFLPQKVATYTEGYRMVQSTTAVTDQAYAQVAYDNGTGRQIYYTTQGAVVAQPQPQQPQQLQQSQQQLQVTAQQYQAMAAATATATVTLNQENGGNGKVVPANLKEFI